VQGIGWALNEEYIYDSKGRLENPGFLDYRIPVASDLPMIEPVMVECRIRVTPMAPRASPRSTSVRLWLPSQMRSSVRSAGG